MQQVNDSVVVVAIFLFSRTLSVRGEISDVTVSCLFASLFTDHCYYGLVLNCIVSALSSASDRKYWMPSRDGRRYVACDLEL